MEIGIVGNIKEMDREAKSTRMNMFLSDRGRHLPERYENIKAFGIVPARDTSSGTCESDMTAFANSLKAAHYVSVACQQTNGETACYILNISLEVLTHYAGQHHAGSFLYCKIAQTEDGGQEAKCSYHEMRNKALPYNRKNNPYLCIGNTDRQDMSLECAIPLESFRRIDTRLTENMKAFEDSDNVIDYTINRVGPHPWLMRKKLYRGLL